MHRRAFLAAACALAPAQAFAQATASAPLRRFAAAATYSAQHDGVAFLVARSGVVLGEDYPNGGAPDARWRIGVATRAFAPLLAASLVKDDLMNLDEPAAMTLGEWGAHPVKSSITLRGLLNGTSGLAFSRRDRADAATAVALEPVAQPGQQFIPDAAPYVILVEIVRRKLEARGRPGDAAAYLTGRTLQPIGCTPIGWTRGQDNAPRFDDGAAVSARAWARAGELIRRDGVWHAQQFVDDRAIREARLGTFAEARAGMGLFLAITGRGDAPPPDTDLWRMSPPAPIDLVAALGEGGQRLYIIPSENLVAVRQARSLDAHGFSDAQFLALLSRDL